MGEPTTLSFTLAFAAGVLSLLSPCVLSLVPAYITYLGGVSAAESGHPQVRARLMLHAALFVAGFSILFVLLGASASLAGQFLLARQNLLRRLAGIAVIVFGLHTTGLITVPILDQERRVRLRLESLGPLRAFGIGVAFGAGWTPCVGPILGSILTLAASGTTLGQGVSLLSAYAAGLGVPFLLMALFVGRLRRWLPAVRRHTRTIEWVTGLLLVGVGVLLLTDGFSRMASWFYWSPL